MKYKTYLSTNFSCKCKTKVSDPNDTTYTLIFDSVSTSDRTEYNTADVNNTNLANFKYYQNHDFHKLAQETDSKISASIIHTN